MTSERFVDAAEIVECACPECARCNGRGLYRRTHVPEGTSEVRLCPCAVVAFKEKHAQRVVETRGLLTWARGHAPDSMLM